MTVSLTAVALATVTGVSAQAATPGKAKPAPKPPTAACTDAYSNAADGSTVTTTTCNSGTGIHPNTIYYVPFNYSLSMNGTIHGREMYRPSSGTFCNYYSGTAAHSISNKTIKIALWKDNGSFNPDTEYANISYPNDGSRNFYCWKNVPNDGSEYYFGYYQDDSSNPTTGTGSVTAG